MMTDASAPFCFVVRPVEPGLASSKRHRSDATAAAAQGASAKRPRSSSSGTVERTRDGGHYYERLSPTDWLPDEVLYIVAERCDLPDLGRLSCVSRSWHRVASDPRLWERAYARHLPPCASPHRCRSAMTDVVSDAAFFAGGLAALGVPARADREPQQPTEPPAIPMDLDAREHNQGAAQEEAIAIEDEEEDHDDRYSVASLPECIPPWALAIGQRLARCCAHVAKSSGAAYAHASIRARTAAAAAPPCRHVPPSLAEAFGLGAAYRASVLGGSLPHDKAPRFVCSPSTRTGVEHRSACVFGHLRAVYDWPAEAEASGTHRARLFTDGRSFTNNNDEVSMVLVLTDADGRTVWALARATPTETASVDDVDWCCVGPFEAVPRPDGDVRATSSDPMSTVAGPSKVAAAKTVHSGALIVARRADGTLLCMPTARMPTFMSTVRGLIYDSHGPCLMRSGASDAVYRGFASRGMRTAKGIARSARGDLVYAGYWDDDLPKGKGTLYAAGGAVVFRGVFAEGMPDGRGTLCVPPLQRSGRPCEVRARGWTQVRSGLCQWVVPCGSGHIRLDDGTCLDCVWDGSGRPPVVVRVHAPATSSLSVDGLDCVLDLGQRPPSLYDDALALLGDTGGAAGSGDDDSRTEIGRRKGARGVGIAADKRQRRDAQSRWSARIPAPFIASRLSAWPPELVPKPGDWVARTLAHESLRFTIDLAPHRPRRLVVDLLDH